MPPSFPPLRWNGTQRCQSDRQVTFRPRPPLRRCHWTRRAKPNHAGPWIISVQLILLGTHLFSFLFSFFFWSVQIWVERDFAYSADISGDGPGLETSASEAAFESASHLSSPYALTHTCELGCVNSLKGERCVCLPVKYIWEKAALFAYNNKSVCGTEPWISGVDIGVFKWCLSSFCLVLWLFFASFQKFKSLDFKKCQLGHTSSSLMGEKHGWCKGHGHSGLNHTHIDTHAHTLAQLGTMGRRTGKGWLSVAIETGGQWCWILLLGRRGRHSESGVTCCGGGNNIRAESEGTLNISV